HSGAEPNILNQCVDEIAGDRFATFLFKILWRSKFNSRVPTRCRRIPTCPDQIIRAHLNVRLDLLLQLAFSLFAAKKPRGERFQKRDDHFLLLTVHSLCIAMSGSTREARHAGTRHAQTDRRPSSATAAK